MKIFRFILLVVLTISAAMVVSAADQKSKPAAKSSEKSIDAQKGELPKGAEQISETTWRYTDPQGKVWIYAKTLFGYSRQSETAAAEEEKASKKDRKLHRVIEVKDGVVKFESDSVFGKSRWSKKVAELRPDEQASYDAYMKSAQQ